MTKILKTYRVVNGNGIKEIIHETSHKKAEKSFAEIHGEEYIIIAAEVNK